MNKKRVFENQLRKLKHILFSNGNFIYKNILITSSVDGEGKTTIATALASMLAEKRYKILLVDINSNNPCLDKVFKLENKGSVSNILVNGKELDSSIRTTEGGFLSVLTFCAGNTTFSEPEKVVKLVDYLKNKYDLVIFDSSALSHKNESLLFAPYLDAVILVVEALKTKWHTVKQAQDELKESDVNLLGIVINKKRYFIPDFLYKRL